ncbi:MAG: hypothetical protein KGJ73_03325 [Rhodospirillales bacterium]|nr:hypothetical protein [Rhodospirillales bacterium]
MRCASDAQNYKSRCPYVEHVEIPRMEDIARFKEISAGKFADIVILENDPLAQDPQTIPALNVTATLVGGKLVYGTLPGYSHVTPELQIARKERDQSYA